MLETAADNEGEQFTSKSFGRACLIKSNFQIIMKLSLLLVSKLQEKKMDKCLNAVSLSELCCKAAATFNWNTMLLQLIKELHMPHTHIENYETARDAWILMIQGRFWGCWQVPAQEMLLCNSPRQLVWHIEEKEATAKGNEINGRVKHGRNSF